MKKKIGTFISKTSKKTITFVRNLVLGISMGMAYGTSACLTANASGFETVSITNTSTDAGAMMGNVIGIILTIMRYVGVAMLVYGVYEIIMSIQNNQPEAKTKGIIMALSGVVMIAIKSVLKGFGVIG